MEPEWKSVIDSCLEDLSKNKRLYGACRNSIEKHLKAQENPMRIALQFVKRCEQKRSSHRACYTLELMVTNMILAWKPALSAGSDEQKIALSILDDTADLRPQIWARLVRLAELKIAEGDLVSTIRKTMLTKNRFTEACDVIQVLNIQGNFTMEDFILPLIQQGRFDVVHRYIQRNPEIREPTIRCLAVQGNKPSTAIKWIQQMNLDQNHFPKVLELQQLNATKWLIRSGKANEFWEVVCERPELRPHFVQMLANAGQFDLASMIANKYEMAKSDDPHLQRALQMLKVHKNVLKEVKSNTLISQTARTTYFEATAPKGIIMVDTKESLGQARLELLHSESGVVGLDAEYMPNLFSVQGSNKPTLLQMSTARQTFLLDLLKFDDAMNDLIREVFENSGIIKIGYSFLDDLSVLRKHFVNSSCFHTLRSFVDFTHVEKPIRENVPSAEETKTQTRGDQRIRGLSKLCQHVFGLPMCKDMQVSNWSRRPLKGEQVAYAALDAYVLVLIKGRIWSRESKPRGALKKFSFYLSKSEQRKPTPKTHM